MPDISIITPSFNQGVFLARTIESVLACTNLQIEHIVMDGGSSDSTQDVLKKYASRITANSNKDRGQAHAINEGLQLAQADIIGWLNSDDTYMPQTLNIVVKYFHDHPEVNIIYGAANWIDKNDNVINTYPTQHWDIEKLKEICYICQPAVFFRKKILIKHGYLNENLHYCLDYEYWLRLALAGERFDYLESVVLAGSRLHESTKSFSKKQEAAAETILMLKEKLGYVTPLFILNEVSATSFKSVLWKIIKTFKKSIQLNGLFLGIRLIVCSRVMYHKLISSLRGYTRSNPEEYKTGLLRRGYPSRNDDKTRRLAMTFKRNNT